MVGLTENPTEIRIKNIGRLNDDKILINRFTVFAGPNNTGKSFVSKLLYSFFNAITDDPVKVYMKRILLPIYMVAGALQAHYRRTDQSKPSLRWLMQIDAVTTEIRSTIDMSPVTRPKIITDLFKLIDSLISLLLEAPKPTEQLLLYIHDKEDQHKQDMLIKEAIAMAHDAKNKLTETNLYQAIDTGIAYNMRDNIIYNFQVPTFQGIQNSREKSSEIEIAGIGSIVLSREEISFKSGDSLFGVLTEQYLQENNPRVIFLESPTYWKLKVVLEDIGHRYYANTDDTSRLSGIPKHFTDLLEMLRYEYVGDIEFPEVHDELTSKSIIGGKMSMSENGDLVFREHDRNFSLHATAAGIVNLGILALLIERKVLNKDSFLFVDDPEAHLHPAWQVYLAENLFKLAQQGVTVVLATHSVDILKWLEVEAKKDSEYKSLIALNQFPIDNKTVEDDFEEKIDRIIYNLTEPFTELYIEGI